VEVGAGTGVGVPVTDTGIEGMGTVRTPDAGVFVGSVGNSSVIEWHPISRRVAAVMPKAILMIPSPSA
jgi:hypothetical protein